MNSLTGFVISWIVNMTIMPLLGYKITASQGFTITMVFTVISMLRSYILRRYFNKLTRRSLA